MLLQPFGVRMAYWTAWTLGWCFLFVTYVRWDHSGNPNPFTLPALVLAPIVAGCVGFAALFTALDTQRQTRYLRAMKATETASERSEAISAALGGRTPDDPRVRAAARRLVDLQLEAYRNNRRVYHLIYPVMSGIWLLELALNIGQSTPRAVLYGALATLWIGMTVRGRLNWRRLERREILLSAA